MIQVLLFLAIFSYNAYKSLLEGSSSEGPVKLLTFATDVVMIGWAVLCFRRNRGFYALPYLVILAIGSTFTMLLSLERVGPANHLSALREPFFFLASLVVVEDIFRSNHADQFKKYFTILLLLFCVAQIPTSYIQFKQYGMGDEVGGTLGWGGPNVVTLLMFISAFYFIAFYGSSEGGDHFATGSIVVFSTLLLPCAINESKISFILIPLFFGLLMISKKLHRLVTMTLLGIAVVSAFSLVYSVAMKDTDFLLDTNFLERYLFYDRREDVDIPRFQKLSMSLDLMSKEPISFLFGMGYGTTTLGRTFEVTEFRRSVWWLSGARAFLNTALMQGGLVLIVCLGLPMFHFLRSSVAHSRNMRRFRWFLALVLAAMWFYHDSLFNRTFALVVAYMLVWTEHGGLDNEDNANSAEDEPEHEVMDGVAILSDRENP